ncbi:MAG: S-layer homology domain-containing protein [Firmicutes bacterium]|nr:S-layer homology domain-containing protein [Bacillota bacterium]
MRKKDKWRLRKRILSAAAAALAAVMLSAAPCLAHSFPDVPEGAWYGQWLEKALESGLVRGYEDGSFRPDAGLSCGEFLAMICAQQEAAYKGGYSHWAAGHYAFATERGWITEGSLPVRLLSERITRRIMAQIIAGAAEAEGLTRLLPGQKGAGDEGVGDEGTRVRIPVYAYSDVGSADPNEYHISLCSSLGILNGYEDGSFRPEGVLRRCEALKAVTAFAELCERARVGSIIFSADTGEEGAGRQAEEDPLMKLLLETARSSRCARSGSTYTVSYEQPEIGPELYFEYHFLLYGSEAEDYAQLLWYDSEYETADYSESYDPSAHSVSRRLAGISSLEGRSFIIHLYAYSRSEGKGSCREIVMVWDDGSVSAELIVNSGGSRILSVPAQDVLDPREVFLW